MDTVCDARQCTMCNACALICPRECIEPQKDKHLWFMTIDKSRCVECHLCETVCPNLTKPPMKEAYNVYAAWAKENRIRKNSASGGVAATLYSYALLSGMYIAGVTLDDKFEAHFEVTKKNTDISKFQNSKYTFSYTDNTFNKIAQLLKTNKKVLFIGLPCQVAGLKKFCQVKKVIDDGLYTVDLICHGTPLPEYLQEHIHNIELTKGIQAEKVYFRDPRYGTGNFLFTIYGKQIISSGNRKFSVKSQASPAYKKLVISNDLYQIGYHNGWIYRECCYLCHYAQRKRVGDLTIGDFHGLGKVEPYNGPMDKVSCLFVNTQKGRAWLNKIECSEVLHIEERPLNEPYTYEPQLSHPSYGGPKHDDFIKKIQSGDGFVKSAADSFSAIVSSNRRKEVLRIYWIKTLIKYLVPSKVLNYIRSHR